MLRGIRLNLNPLQGSLAAYDTVMVHPAAIAAPGRGSATRETAALRRWRDDFYLSPIRERSVPGFRVGNRRTFADRPAERLPR
jgi:hypothetical protein